MERTDLEQWRAREVARLLALVETERRYYQEMVATLPVALVVLSVDRSVSSANRAFRQTFGLRSKDLRGKTIEQILPSDRLIEKIRDAHVTGATQTGFPLEHDGRQFTVGIVPIRNWDDESEVETLLAIQEAGGMQATTIAAPLGPVPAILWEADGATLEFRSVRGEVGLLGYAAEHWTGTPQFFEDRIHPEDRLTTLEFYFAAIGRGAGEASAEFRAVTASGGTVWVRETIRVKNGTLTGVMTSIAQREQLEDQWLRSERAHALQGMASRLAHDLNNPLMIVTGYAEEMRNSLSDDDPMRGDVDQILTATERISGIAGQLLNYTRRHAHMASAMNLTYALAQMEEKIALAAGQGCAVHLGSSDTVWALADEGQLEEVVLALVSHDRDDAKERSHLTIGCDIDTITEHVPGMTLAAGTYARITIHDDGKGLDQAGRAAVFEGFLTKHGETTAAAGLARAYGIVREWGGDIACFSEPFRGTTFLVYLPYCAAPAERAVEAPGAQGPVVEIPVEVVRETILLVEDEAGIRALVRKILRRENYNVLEAGSAEEAMAMASAATGRIDLLVTDVMLPGASGRELAERIRETRQDLKVLYISGYTDDDAVRTGAIPPGSKFLQKPFTLGALVGKVRESLG
ncbi:MAG TPA: response regulator [Bryobacteraceae bacterium]|nr:response regulator [Bryobacteraceae bacterium]